MFRPADILERLHTQPFEPFRLHVSDGAHYDVLHPEFVVVMTSRLLILVPAPNQPGQVFERYDAVALIHITRLEPLAQASSSSN